jgi:hypothetical protein
MMDSLFAFLSFIVAGFGIGVATKAGAAHCAGGATYSAVIPRESGESSTPQPIRSIAAVSAYWIARSSRTMKGMDEAQLTLARMVLEKSDTTNDVRLPLTATVRLSR